MAKSKIDLADITRGVDRLGMRIFGGFEIAARHCPSDIQGFAGKHALLVGNVGSAMWEQFSTSAEYADGSENAMDRWTRRELTAIADRNRLDVIFPFDRPFWPFQQFLAEATGMRQSPLGLYIHSKYGLWQGVRGALVPKREVVLDISNVGGLTQAVSHPCDDCLEKPCISACPVNAFENGLDVAVCFAHLDGSGRPDCMSDGCNARNACPVGHEYRYSSAQLQFHMAAFRC